jgi:hypothetical protein
MSAQENHDRQNMPVLEEQAPLYGNVRRLGSAVGLATISVLDLIALDDITTAGAWMPEIVFVIGTIPALVTMAYFVFHKPSSTKKEAIPHDRLAP